MPYNRRGEVQILAQTLLRSNSIELADDPRDEISVALALGYLTLSDELRLQIGLPRIPPTEV